MFEKLGRLKAVKDLMLSKLDSLNESLSLILSRTSKIIRMLKSLQQQQQQLLEMQKLVLENKPTITTATSSSAAKVNTTTSATPNQPAPQASSTIGGTQPDDINYVVSQDFLEKPIYAKLVAARFSSAVQSVILLGHREAIDFLKPAFTERGYKTHIVEWDWDQPVSLDRMPQEAQVIVCNLPMNESQWNNISRLKCKYESRIVGIQELALPISALQLAQASFDYYLKGLDAIVPYYLGEKYIGRVDELNQVYPLKDKRVIEFGPLDGCQTANLITLGVKSLTSIEARPENLIKVMVACHVFGWNNFNLIMDDFHNADVHKYGRFDLAFAHGVYYHSTAPFLFLENLMSLAKTIFLGGFCATDSLPEGEYEILEYCGKQYRVKRYQEWNGYTGGINKFGYFFHKEDLLRFFVERGYNVSIISDEEYKFTAGNYLRFLATQK